MICINSNPLFATPSHSQWFALRLYLKLKLFISIDFIYVPVVFCPGCARHSARLRYCAAPVYVVTHQFFRWPVGGDTLNRSLISLRLGGTIFRYVACLVYREQTSVGKKFRRSFGAVEITSMDSYVKSQPRVSNLLLANRCPILPLQNKCDRSARRAQRVLLGCLVLLAHGSQPLLPRPGQILIIRLSQRRRDASANLPAHSKDIVDADEACVTCAARALSTVNWAWCRSELQ